MYQTKSTLAFITESIPAFTVGRPYDFSLEAVGGTPPYNFAVTQGALPNGVSMSATGRISGTPNRPGGTTAFVKLSDAAGDSVTQAFDCQIN